MIAIKLQNNVACEYICHQVQKLVHNYQQQNNNMTDLILVIDIKQPTDLQEPIKLIEHSQTNLAP
jgi:hypothetical protein